MIEDAACSGLTNNAFYCLFRIDVWETNAAKFADGKPWPVGVAVRDVVSRRTLTCSPFPGVDPAMGC